MVNEPLEALANGVSGGNGVYRYGGSAFPDSTNNAANYWVDVVFTTSTQTDTTAPTVVSTVPADGATEAEVGAPITVTFSESLAAATVTANTVELRDALNASVSVIVTYSGTNVVTVQPATPLASNASYTVRVIGGASGVTDLAGNPLAGDVVWTFTTQLDSVVDTTTADFGGGTRDTGIYVAHTANGELTLLPSVASEFDEAALPNGWSATQWSATGTFGVAGGALTVDGARVSPTAVAGAGASLEFRATFSTDSREHAGFGVTFNEVPWAIFSTGAGGGSLYARTHDGVSAIDTPIPGSWLGSPHTYRIDWNSASVTFFIDGVEVASRAVTIGGLLRPIVSDSNVGGGALTVDWLRLTPYATSGTFVSRVLSMGVPTDWARASWTAVVPASTTLTLAARFGDTPTPDGSWTGFIALPTADTSLALSSTYVQYQAILPEPALRPPFCAMSASAGPAAGSPTLQARRST